MDGFQERLKGSIRLRLSLWLVGAIVFMAVAGGAISFATAIDEANELQDDTLQQVVNLLAQQPALTRHLIDTDSLTTDAEPSLHIHELSAAAPAPTSEAPSGKPALRHDLPDGFQTVEAHGESHRVLAKTLSNGKRIAISQATSVRDEIARDSALRTVLPLLILIPVLLLVVTDLVRRMLLPVAQMATEVEARSESELHALPERGLPSEIRPFVLAINRLLARVAMSMETQRRFIADAAHELRSPMTAMSLQAEMLDGSGMSADAREKLASLRRGIERGRVLLNQLLDLARAQSNPPVAPVPWSVQKVFRRVLEDAMPLAEAKQIDLGVKNEADAVVMASEVDLITLVKNLVENAVRYTPEGGRVDISVSETTQQVVIEVEDNGPGIAPEERERVLDPFYRVLGSEQSGSGLGLSIVKAIAERLRGRLVLQDATAFEHGLKVQVVLDKAA